jgi:hypothetical protein
MPETYFPPGATPEQCRRIVAACAKMLEPPRAKPKRNAGAGSKAVKSSPGGAKPKCRKP